VLCNWWSDREPPPSFEEYERLGARVALYPTIAAMGGLQGAWELLNDFQARGPAALADWSKRAAAGPFGAADYKRFTDHARIAELERDYLSSAAQRDAASNRGWGRD
jgi:hypothetical protein